MKLNDEKTALCGESVNKNNSSFIEMLTTYKKCLDALIYVNFGDVSRKRLGLQCQHGSRYVDGAIDGWENLGKGLRFKGKASDYHSLKIHKDDVEEFVRRYKEYLNQFK